MTFLWFLAHSAAPRRQETLRHRIASVRLGLIVGVALALGVPVFGVPGSHAAPVQVTFEVLDAPDVGFNDPVLGPQRLQAFAFAAARWGSFFVSAFPGETVPVGIRFGPLADFVAFSNTFHFDTGDVSLPGALAEHLVGGDVLPGLDGVITFSAQEPFYLGTTGQPASTQFDFVTFAMHELGHIFGFTSFLQADGTYQGSPTVYDLFVGDVAGNQLVALPPAARLAAATSGDGLLWLGPQGIAGNNGVPPQLSAGTPFVLATNVNHLSETFGPDVLMDPDKAFGEVIHDLSPLERGMYEDLFWSLTPVQAVPEPASLWLVVVGLVGLLWYGCRRRRCAP